MHDKCRTPLRSLERPQPLAHALPAQRAADSVISACCELEHITPPRVRSKETGPQRQILQWSHQVQNLCRGGGFWDRFCCGPFSPFNAPMSEIPLRPKRQSKYAGGGADAGMAPRVSRGNKTGARREEVCTNAQPHTNHTHQLHSADHKYTTMSKNAPGTLTSSSIPSTTTHPPTQTGADSHSRRILQKANVVR